MNYRVLSIDEATPLLLDRSLSPVVALDTEFDPDGPFPGRLRGASIAGGTPETGFFGTFWSFEEPYQQIPYEQFHRNLIEPIAGDPERTLVMHPLTVDMKQLRARGLTSEMTRCKLEDTIAQAYIFDDNLPHSLKDLAYCILLKTTATSYAVTQREIESIRKEGGKETKRLIQQVWDCYAEHRKKSSEIEAQIDAAWPGWQRLAMSLPPGMNRSIPKSWTCSGKTGCGAKNVIDPTIVGPDCMTAKAACPICSKPRKITYGVEQHVAPIISRVVQVDYDRRAYDRFARYGAEDAIYTLAIRYHFLPTFTPRQLEHLELETKVTYPCVTEMEERGLKIDIPLLEEIAMAMSVAIDTIDKEVIEAWTSPTDEEPFNPASPDQVAKRIWLDWGVSPPSWAKHHRGGIKPKHRRKKDGLCAADRLILDAVAKRDVGTHHGDAIQKLLDSRRWVKLYGTYVEAILKMAKLDPDGRVHSSFWPTGARSGRFSSSEPNVENIPRPFTMPTIEVNKAMQMFPGFTAAEPPRGFVIVTKKADDGTKHVVAWRVRSLREIFISPKGFIYVSADLSQIENRFTAYQSRDANMLALYRDWDCAECGGHGSCNTILHECPQCGAAEGKRDKKHADQPVLKGFVHGKDIHSATAASLGFFEKYGADGRQQGKPVNHAATYGMGAQTMAKRENIPVKDADASLRAWHRTYPGIRGDLDHAAEGSLHQRVTASIFEVGQVEMFDGHLRRFHAQQMLKRSGNFDIWKWEGTIREGVNVLMQGGTGVVMKRAMIRVREEIIKRGWWGKVFLVNQVHDELLYECAEDIAEEFLKVLIYVMEHSAPEIDVPVAADGGTGINWGLAH